MLWLGNMHLEGNKEEVKSDASCTVLALARRSKDNITGHETTFRDHDPHAMRVTPIYCKQYLNE